VAIAPDGKEVEELTGKEILLALRRKIPTKDFLYRNSNGSEGNEVTPFSGDVPSALKEKYSEIKGTKKALLLSVDLSVAKTISSVAVAPALNRIRGKIVAVVIDGIATKQIIQTCEEKGVSYIVAKNFAAVETNVKLIGA